jgi:PqqD family protein of HPr-rel-A system
MADHSIMDVLRQGKVATGWKILEKDVLHWEQWGTQFALYDALSGETHLLPEFSARVLQQLSVQPLTVEALAKLLCSDSDETCDQVFMVRVSQLLVELQAVGLTENIQL